jgi:hypothetical protein
MLPLSSSTEHKELALLVARNLQRLAEHLDEVAGIPGDYSDPHCALLARFHADLERMQLLLEKLRPPPLVPGRREGASSARVFSARQ